MAELKAQSPGSLQRMVRLIYCTTLLFLCIASICHSIVIFRLQNRARTQGQVISRLTQQLSRLQSESRPKSDEASQPHASNQPVPKQRNTRDCVAHDDDALLDVTDLTRRATPCPSSFAVA